MENYERRLIGGGLEEMPMSAMSTSASPDETTTFHTTIEECLSSLDEVALGDCSGAGSSMEPKSEYFSARVEEMMRSKSQFSSGVECEIEHSRVHWSEVSGLSDFSEDDNNDYEEEVNRENEEIFEELMNDPRWTHPKWGHFFVKWQLQLGQKIAEGGQAAIFEVVENDGSERKDFLLKVFKRGTRLSDLKKQWPRGILLSDLKKQQWPRGILRRKVHPRVAIRGTMLDDGRFAFLMFRCWGDLRKLIDQAMQEKNNQGPPFPCDLYGQTLHVKDIMLCIALDMASLHKHNILHKDLKAANIFLRKDDQGLQIQVADFECSQGVVGTGFWRAPEILLALKNRSAIKFTSEVDVYSYGMTCFEIITGRLPFEGELEVCRASNDLVIDGRRPKLPSNLNVSLKNLIERCWDPIPYKRPSFQYIIYRLRTLDKWCP